MSLPHQHHTQQRLTGFLTPEHRDAISEEGTGEEQVFEDMSIFFCPGETNFHFREPCKNWVGLSLMASPGDSGKESACSEGEQGSVSGWGRSPGEGIGNPIQYSSLENSRGQRSLAGYSPWGHKESDRTEAT